MNFILIDGVICIVTHFTCDEDVQTEQIGSSTRLGSSTVVTGRTINGEMFVFSQDSLPELFDGQGLPKTVDVEFARDGDYYTMGDVMFTSFEPKPHSYDKCEAACVEYVAADVSVERAAKDINSGITI